MEEVRTRSGPNLEPKAPEFFLVNDGDGEFSSFPHVRILKVLGIL